MLHLKAVERQEYNDALTLESSSMSSLKDYTIQNSFDRFFRLLQKCEFNVK